MSIATPVALLLYRRRPDKYLPRDRHFKLPRRIGYLVNIITVGWALVILVFFTFPVIFPVEASTMSMSYLILLIVANMFV